LALEPVARTRSSQAKPRILAATQLDGPRGDLHLEQVVLPAFLTAQPWFPWRHRGLRDVSILDEIPLGYSRMLVLSLNFVDGFPEILLQPVALAAPASPAVKSEQAKAVLVRLDDGRSMVDGFYDDRFRTELLHLLARGGT